MHKKLVRVFSQILGPFGCVALTIILLRLFETILNVQNIALLFLIPVMASTVLWGLTPGLIAGFISFLAFNYFFIKPYNTLLVHESQDLLTLTIFLVVAFVMSQLIGQARKALLLARSKEWEATQMYELISSLSGITEVPKIGQVFADRLMHTFNFSKVKVIINDRTSGVPLIITLPLNGEIISSPSRTLAMKTSRNLEGEMQIWYSPRIFSQEEDRLLTAFSDQGALAIERIRLTEGETKIRILEESDRLKTSLLNSVSHELRSPLAAIKAAISSLRSGTVEWNDPARKELLTMVEEETDRLNLLVGNLLDMSRIESGSLKPNERWNSINEIVRGVAVKMANQLKDHFIEFDLPQDLPLIPTDYVMMEQVFTNLISNSIKYAPAQTKIIISGRLVGDSMQIRVQNQSAPVSEENLGHIFEKFHRVTEADKVLGTGLGLSICKGIIEAHGGKIWAENLSHGFCFVFTLPLTLDGNSPQIPGN